MTDRPTKRDPEGTLADLCAVLEALGYAVECSFPGPPVNVTATHPANLPVSVYAYSDSVELFTHWPTTENAAANPAELLAVVNDLNALCRLVTCSADPEQMTVRACFPFAFDAGLFWAFLEAWMEDGRDLLAEVHRLNRGCLNVEVLH